MGGLISLPQPALARPKGARCSCRGGDDPRRARDQSRRRGPWQQLKNLGLLPKNKTGRRDAARISNVQEPRGGTAQSVPVLGCHSRREQPGSSQRKAGLRQGCGSARRNCDHVAKIREHSHAAAQGWGSTSPLGTLELHGRAGTPEGANTQGRALSSPWQWGPAHASHSSGHSGPSTGRGHQVRGQRLQGPFASELTAFFPNEQ